ncbi:unnamed protein product, partial [Allacma fusca]
MATKIRSDSIEKLSGSNYQRWKLQITLLLKAAKLWKYVDGSVVRHKTDKDEQEKWDDKDIEAQSIIVPTLDAAQTNHIYSCTTSKDMFDRLREMNSDCSTLNKQHTLTKFLNYKVGTSQSPVQAMMEMEELVRCLQEMKVTLDEATVVTKVISSLPDDYRAFKKAWDSVPEANQTRAMLMSRLKKEELERKTDSDAAEEVEMARAFASRPDQIKKMDKKTYSPDQKRRPKCYKCGKIGHIRKDCRSGQTPKEQQERKGRAMAATSSTGNTYAFVSTTSGINEVSKMRSYNFVDESSHVEQSQFEVPSNPAFMGKSKESFGPDDWVSDSGATQHFCGDESWFTELQKNSGKSSVVNADNGTSKSSGIGTVAVEANIRNKWVRCELNNVIYVPGGANLFSEGIMEATRGYTIVRKNRRTVFTDHKGVEGPVADYKDCGLYIMRFRRPSNNNEACALGVKTVTTNLWHRRLAHVNHEYIKESVGRDAVDGIKKVDIANSDKCEECQLGKQSRKPYPRKSSVRACNPGEIIHADLAGPMNTPSLGGAKYFLLLKDQASGFRLASFLKFKNETAKAVQDFVNFLETQTGNKVKEFWTDNGTELVNQTLNDFFKDKGVVRITSSPYCPQMNGKIERDIRTIKDSARTMLVASQVPNSLWAEAVATAVFVHNRLLDSVHRDVTPFEAIFKKKPRLDHLREFGCMAFAHIPEIQRSGFDPKGKRTILVGYGSHNIKFRLYDEETGKVFEAHNVTFFEGQPGRTTLDTTIETEDNLQVTLQTSQQTSVSASNEQVDPRPCHSRSPASTSESTVLEYSKSGENITLGTQALKQSNDRQPDLAATTNSSDAPNKFVSAFDEQHWKAAKQVLRYLKRTADLGITYNKLESQNEDAEVFLTCYTDSDYAGDKVQRKSTSGVVVLLNNAIVSWSSQKQSCIALSSTEAEYVAVASGAREVVWLRSCLSELGYPQVRPTLVLVDNQSAIRLVKNPEMHARTKHIDVRYHYIRDQEAKGEVSVQYVPTTDQLADGLTKPLLKSKLEMNRDRLGIRPVTISRLLMQGVSIVQIIICLLMLIGPALCQPRVTVPVVWRKSAYPVTIGNYEFDMRVTLLNPCDIFTNQTVHRDLVTPVREKCSRLYKEMFLDELEVMCPPRKFTDLAVRPKREILIALAVMAIVAALGLGIAAVAQSNANAAAIEEMEQQLLVHGRILEQLEDAVKNNSKRIREMEEKFNTAIKDLGDLQADHDEMKGKYMDTSYAISYITTKMMMGRNTLRETRRQWKLGKVNEEFLDYFNITLPCAESCPVQYARSGKCALTEDRSKLYFEFAAPIISEDL